MDILNPEIVNFPIPHFDAITMLVFGAPGTGKTTFCTSTPGTLVFSTEPGADFIKCVARPTYDWDVFKKDVATLYNHYLAIKNGQHPGPFPYQAFVIDIIDNLTGLCRDDVCKRRGLQYPPTNDFGRTWASITAEFKQELRKLMFMGGVRFISHVTTVTIETEGENGMKVEVERQQPTFSGNKAAQFLDGIVHCQGYCGINKRGEHRITFRGSAMHAAKDRTQLLACEPSYDLNWHAVASAYSLKATEMGRTIRRNNGCGPNKHGKEN